MKFIIYIATLMTTLTSCGQTVNQKLMKQDINKFIDSYPNFNMDIQGAGIASIPIATISDKNELYIEYAYHSEGENRKGKMTLSEKSNNRFEGNWKTIADNGNVYQGTLFFVFKANGEADGYYKYAGSDYKITIFTKEK
jgi:hypothetical protein